jgi:hypothetical protein
LLEWCSVPLKATIVSKSLRGGKGKLPYSGVASAGSLGGVKSRRRVSSNHLKRLWKETLSSQAGAFVLLSGNFLLVSLICYECLDREYWHIVKKWLTW